MGVGVSDRVIVGEAVEVRVQVTVGEKVAVAVRVGEKVAVAAGVAVRVGVKVGVGVLVGVPVGDGVKVGPLGQAGRVMPCNQAYTCWPSNVDKTHPVLPVETGAEGVEAQVVIKDGPADLSKSQAMAL